jgi:hypothetical protein
MIALSVFAERAKYIFAEIAYIEIAYIEIAHER